MSADVQTINPSVRLEREGSIGTIVLTRAKQINAINDEIRFGVPQVLKELDADPAIQAIIIRGEGERGFCAGADIKEQRAPESAVELRQRMGRTRWIESLDTIETTVIAALHGYCMGGGMELALACDIRFASPDVVMSLPETALGLIPGGGGTQRLPRLIGEARALDLVLTGDRLNAQEALALGLVTRVASSPETLLEEAAALAQRIAKRPPLATRYAKRAIKAAADMDLHKGFDLELDLFAFLKQSDDAKEAAVAFKEKREPEFSGR